MKKGVLCEFARVTLFICYFLLYALIANAAEPTDSKTPAVLEISRSCDASLNTAGTAVPAMALPAASLKSAYLQRYDSITVPEGRERNNIGFALLQRLLASDGNKAGTLTEDEASFLTEATGKSFEEGTRIQAQQVRNVLVAIHSHLIWGKGVIKAENPFGGNAVEDLIQAHMLGLVQAVDAYASDDEIREKNAFGTIFEKKVLGAMRDTLLQGHKGMLGPGGIELAKQIYKIQTALRAEKLKELEQLNGEESSPYEVKEPSLSEVFESYMENYKVDGSPDSIRERIRITMLYLEDDLPAKPLPASTESRDGGEERERFDVIGDTSQASQDEFTEWSNLKSLLEGQLAAGDLALLTPNESTIIRVRYGIGTEQTLSPKLRSYAEERTVLAEMLKMSIENVKRIEQIAMKKLREYFQSGILDQE